MPVRGYDEWKNDEGGAKMIAGMSCFFYTKLIILHIVSYL